MRAVWQVDVYYMNFSFNQLFHALCGNNTQKHKGIRRRFETGTSQIQVYKHYRYINRQRSAI